MNFADLKLPIRIETTRVYLRFLNYTDRGWYYDMALRNKQHLREFESGNAIFCIHNEEDAEAMMDHFEDICEKRKEFYLGVFLRQNDEFVGQVFIGSISPDPNQQSCSLGFFSEVSHQGKGYMTEAVHAALHFIFVKLHAERVNLECDAANSRSSRLAERCGFEKREASSEGTSTAGSFHFVISEARAKQLDVPQPQYHYN